MKSMDCKTHSPDLNISEIFQKYEKPIFHYIMRMVQDRADAEDLTQEVFVKVYRKLSDFRGDSGLSTWIYRLATNLCLDHFRKKTYRQSYKTERLEISVSIEGNTSGMSPPYEGKDALPADNAVIESEMNECIHRYIEKLPENYRAVILLSELQEFKDREIAEILGCSLETVKIRLHRARKRLKNLLEMNCSFYHNENNSLCCDKK